MKRFFSILWPWKRSREAMEEVAQQGTGSFWTNAKKQFRKNRVAVWSLRFIVFLVVIALLADILANEKPLACRYKGHTYFPVFREYAVDLGITIWPKDLQNVTWKELDYEWSVFPPVPYLPTNIDSKNVQYVSPFGKQDIPSGRWRHWFGTDELGRDVLSGLIHGTRVSLLVGLLSMGIASLIGIFLGAMAGYFGDERLKISRSRMIFIVIFIPLSLFYGFGVRSYALHDALASSFGLFMLQLLFSLVIIAAVITLAIYLSKPFERIRWLGKPVSVPVDLIVSRLIELMVSIPTLFLIISIAAIVTKPSLFITMCIIGMTSWTGIARFIRAELLRVRGLEYIEAANAMGFSERRIIFRHAIPNALSPVLIAIAFGIASAILTESTLSFIGLGVPSDTVTWGSLLTKARQAPTAWWLAVFPGFAIFMTVTVYNLVGEGLTDALDPRLRK